MASTDIDVRPLSLTTEQRASLRTFEDIAAALGMGLDEMESISDYGDGFEAVQDKSDLVGVPLILIEWRFGTSDKYYNDKGELAEYVIVRAMTASGHKIFFSDGGTGIYAQLRRVTDSRVAAGNVERSQCGLGVRAGLVRSEYTTVIDGKKTPGETFYLSEA